MAGAKTLIGTSGWNHADWRKGFYPEHLSTGEWLAWYCTELGCVEVSDCFYRLPEPDEIAAWCGQTPEDFRFTVRAPRHITHTKKLKNCETELQTFLTRLNVFAHRLGPVLFELPGVWGVNTRRLSGFLEQLPEGRRYAFQCGEPSWHRPEVYDLLGAHGAAFCIFDRDGATAPLEATGDFVYVRLHGPATTEGPSYRPERIRTWVGRALAWNRAGKDVFLCFNNVRGAVAARNARLAEGFLRDGVAHPGRLVSTSSGA